VKLRILVVLMGLLLVAGTASCSSDSASSTSLYSAKDALRVTAKQLYGAYRKHRAAADARYKGKLLEVTGVVYEVGTDRILSDAPEVMLTGGAFDRALGVDCTFDERYDSETAKLKPGQTTAVLGICDGFAVNVLLLRCQPAR
jgi:hypothetical protein